MGFFSKGKKEKQGFFVNTEEENIKISGDKNLAPHAMTAEEVSELWIFGDEEETYTKTSALDSLKKRMNVAVEKTDNDKADISEDKTEPAKPKNDTPKAESVPVPEVEKVVVPKIEKVDLTKVEEDIKTEEKAEAKIDSSVEVNNDVVKITEDSVKVNEEISIIPEAPKKSYFAKDNNKTLVEKVKRYTVDENGHDMAQNQQPIYELQSVAEILKNDSESAMKSLSQKYGLDFSVDYLGKNHFDVTNLPLTEETPQEETKEKPEPITKSNPTPAFEEMVIQSEIRESRELYENLFPNEKEINIPDISVPDISDIDTHEVGISTEPPISNTATIRFTPIKNSKGITDRITISNITKQIDLGDNIPDDISSHSTPELEQSEFDEFTPKAEYCDAASGKKILHNLAKLKRFNFISSILSALVVFTLLIFLLPPVSDQIIAHPKKMMFVCTGILSVSVLANINMFFDFKNLFNRKAQFDVLASLFAIFTIAFGITAALTKSDAYYIILCCSIVLFTRAVFKFRIVSSQYKSLRLITGDKPKNAVTLINDPATTFAMVKNAIDGNVLVAAHKKSNFIKDFMKHFEFHKTISGKASILFFITLGLSALCSITAYFYYDSIFDAFFAAASISCLAALPTAFFIDALPFSSAAKKLNVSGSMIAGIYGAEKIENANAVVVNINDIFPSGTITMHNMQVLSDNNIDEILLRAASLTAAVGSPLNAIFERIAGTSSDYSIPDSDTVKYEKNLGISGWVDNEPLFIGNRSLMKAHGIEIPSLEIDKKILRKGYFPVYVATSSTACALIVIQYNVDPVVAKQLHKITDLGILLLVENCDPNVTDQMLCDYFGLYDDSVKVMTNAGLHMYKNLVPDVESCSSPAVFRGSGLNFIKVINCASGIKKSNKLLIVLYTLFAIMGALYFVYAEFSGLMSIPQQETVLLYTIATTALSIIGFLIRKP